MIGYKIAKFFGVGAVIFLATYFIADSNDNRVLIVGLIFAGISLLSVNITNVQIRREKIKTRL